MSMSLMMLTENTIPHLLQNKEKSWSHSQLISMIKLTMHTKMTLLYFMFILDNQQQLNMLG